MNAYELYDAAFDNANDHVEYSASYVTEYAEGAYDICIEYDVAKQIADCALNFRENGNGTNDLYYMVEKPLSEIEI